MKKIGFISLGCAKNLVDTERMIAAVREAGFAVTNDERKADVIVVNTCGFIESAKRESIETILDCAALKKGRKKIVVAGCLAERYPDEIKRDLPEADAVLGVGSYLEIVPAIRALLSGEGCYFAHGDKNTSPIGGDRVLSTPAGSAYLKIAEGCDNRCTYCAIPLIRGKFRSRPIEKIVAEAKTLEREGVKELNLIAQDTSRYGLDLYGEYRLADLVRAITKETAIPWIRLLYCYPDKITDDLIAEFKNNPRLLPYVDLPIQHISDRMLTAMNRHGGSALIREVTEKLRREVPNVVLRTTAMVGFPGETEADFEELCAFIKEAKFDRFGAFTYSPEEGTEAAEYPDRIDEQVKQDRYDVLMQTQLTATEEASAARVGKTYDVLVEGYDKKTGEAVGRSYAEAPDVDGKIYFLAKTPKNMGDFASVLVTKIADYDCIGVEN